MNRITLFAGVLGFALAARAASPPVADVTPAKNLPQLKISANGRFFVQDNGKPFFYLADTAWGLFPHATPDDVDVYLHDRAAKGFTVIQAVAVLWDGSRRPNYDSQLPFIGNDPAKPNEAYFQNMDRVIDKAQSLGLHVAVLPFWLKGMRNNVPGLLDPPTAQGFCHYLGSRYRDKPVIWILGGDTAGNTPGGPDYLPLVRAMAAGLRSGDGGTHLITYHPTGRQSSSFWFQNEPWLDFDLLQSGHFIQNTNYDMVALDYAKSPAKPIVDGEPGYENITDRLVSAAIHPDAKRIGAQDVRRYGYLSVFAGAAGHTYGNGEVYEFWTPASGPPPRWAAGLPWRQSLELPGSSQMQFLRKLMESRPMLLRIPDQNLIVGDASSTTDRLQGTRASDGSYAFIYTASGRPIQARLQLLAGDTIRAYWYDPRTGAATLIGDNPKADTQTFTPPDNGSGNDWVLVLDNAAAHFPPPGSTRAVEN
jgi:hypothetical protein